MQGLLELDRPRRRAHGDLDDPAADVGLTSFISFIASTMPTGWPGSTMSPTWTNGSRPGCGRW